MIDFNFKPKFSIAILITFIVFTVVGTVTHELGHIAVAKSLGYETKLSYGFMSYNAKGYIEDEKVKEFFQIIEEFKEELLNKKDFEKAARFHELESIINKKYPKNKPYQFYVTLGGPLQTLLTCFIGLLIIWFRKNKSKKEFKLVDWLGVFLGLFILREVFNFVSGLCSLWFFNKNNFYGDEFGISRYIGFNQWIVPSISFILGLAISLFIIFKVIPIKYRFSFIISGFIGGLLGFAIWFGFLGSIILP